MFSGLVEEIGAVRRLERHGPSATLEILAQHVLERARLGDSMAVDGVCLTITALTGSSFKVDLSPETLRRTTLGHLKISEDVNLERSLAVGDRIGGHFVQGHIDGVGSVRMIRSEGAAFVVTFAAPPEVIGYIVPKGCVAVDGMSLTVMDRFPDGFTVSFIPYTMAHTIANSYHVGSAVNLEADILGKYVEQFLLQREGASTMTHEFLRQHGFA
jgi:riboflavin synthase